MKPMETHLELSRHVWMLNRVKELLMKEGILSDHATEEETKAAMTQWLDMVSAAKRAEDDEPLMH